LLSLIGPNLSSGLLSYSGSYLIFSTISLW
jgi:hypothetical protein